MQEYCTLEPVSRKLTLTEPQRIAGVESDENVRCLKFKFPKTIDRTDFTQMQLRINFINSRQEKGQHIVTDLKPLEGEEGYITFTWPFSRLVTHYRGYTKFVICAVKTDEGGTITAEWNTALTQMRVLEGLEVDKPEISPEEKDVIAQLISICQDSADDAVQSAQRTQEEAEKVLTYGPEIGENGNWYLKGEDTGHPSRGEKGEQGIPGAKGETGAPGKDGAAPEIGANGNWYIDGKDTGKPSRGEKGETGDKGEKGAAGKDGITPTIGANGNWFVGQDDTGKPSRGEAGMGVPEPTAVNAGKVPVVNSEGTGYELQQVAGAEIWEEIGTIPLSPDITSYELGEVDEWERLRLFVTRTYNKDLSGNIWLRVGTSAGASFTPKGYATQQYDMSVNNLHQFEVKAISVNNSQAGGQAQSFPAKAPGFAGLNNYPYAPGDKYRLIAATDASLCFDGTETARLFGVRRK